MKKIRITLIAVIAVVLCCGFTPSQPAKVYVGGFPVGISLDVGGLLVESVTGVETKYGVAYVEGLEQGDLIIKIDGRDVEGTGDIGDMISPEPVRIELIRGGNRLEVTVKPIVELFTGLPRLGVKIKDKFYGVGTVTFVRADGSYAALGHEIFDGDESSFPFAGGNIHACKIVGIKRGKGGEAGAILGSVIPDRVLGSVTCNNSFGIAGKLRDIDGVDKGEQIEIAPREFAHAGAAKIRTNVDGSAKYYDIEIIKASKQSGRKQKGMVFRITDGALLEKTGGVLRGMSGSPIIQDGKLIGCVTHVFLNDFTKGFGLYADCLNLS